MGQKNTTNSASEKAPGLQSEGSKKNTTNVFNFTGNNPAQIELTLEFKPEAPAAKVRKYRAKSTATEAQYDRIIAMLQAGPKSTFDFRKVGIMSPASRIKELNDRYGFDIPTVDLRDLYDDHGYLHKRVGIYQLMGAPKEGGFSHE
jgi:hypothetical protein